MASTAENRINLTALKQKDPYISNIIDSSTQVAVYTFNHQTEGWEKTEVEGALFVYSRLVPPKAGFTIMNRLSMNNLTEPLTSEMDFQNQAPFLLYRNSKSQIFGVWFYDMYDCNRIGNLLVELCKNNKNVESTSSVSLLSKHPRLSTPSSNVFSSEAADEQNITESRSSSSKDNGIIMKPVNGTKPSVDIMGILCKAKDTYDKNHASKESKIIASQHHQSSAKSLKYVSNGQESNKLNVASLFGVTEEQRPGDMKRRSSADMFKSSETKTDQNSSETPHIHRRYNNRSLSLSLNDGSLHRSAGHLNGAICVEELESPALGFTSQRTRFHSTTDDVVTRHTGSSRPSVQATDPFHKLLRSPASYIPVNESNNIAEQETVHTASPKNFYIARSATTSSVVCGRNSNSKMKRDLSSANGAEKINVSQCNVPGVSDGSHTATTESSMHLSHLQSILSAMPTLHENVFSKAMLKNNSFENDLAPLPGSVEHYSVQVATNIRGSHTSVKEKAPLLFPDELQLKMTSSQHVPKLSRTYSNSTLASALSAVSVSSSTVLTPTLSEPKTLISPEDFEHSTETPEKTMELRHRLLSEDSSNNRIVLDKNQLAKSLIKLLQTDNSFIDAIHQTYLSGITQSNS